MQNTEMQYFRLFRDVCKVINSSLNVGDVLQLIAKNLVKALDVRACAVFLLDREKNTLEVRTTYGLSKNYLKKGPLSADESIGATLKEESVLIYDVANDPRVQYPEEAKREGVSLNQLCLTKLARPLGWYRQKDSLKKGKE